MCSIVGFINLSGSNAASGATAIVHDLLQSTKHRGPDDSRVHAVGNQAVLGANRLAIVDRFNNAASTPIVSPDGSVALVLNGEIYNHHSLRDKLRAYYPFQTESDSEAVLACYLRFGAEFVHHLRGMFAIIICDSRTGETLVCVDRMGEKPLYAYLDETRAVISSELRSLVDHPALSCPLVRERVAEAALFRFSPTCSTPYRNISRIKPGELSIFTRDGECRRIQYWRPPQPSPEATSLITPRDMHDLVASACVDTLTCEEPLGVLLSGGLDSTIITHFAHRLCKEVHTFSIGFCEEHVSGPRIEVPLNEFLFSRNVAEVYGTIHHEIEITSDTYWDSFEHWCRIQADPQGVEEAPCLLHLCGEVSNHCRIVACGSGPDEALEGYGHASWLAQRPVTTPASLLYEYLSVCSWFGDCDPSLLCVGEDPRAAVVQALLPMLEPYIASSRSLVDAVQYINVMTRLHAYELRQMDLASMHWSVEARSPLADVRVLEKALACSSEQKTQGGVRKKLLVDAFAGVLPSAVIARKKEGFPIPVHLMYTRRFEAMVSQFLSESLIESLGIFNFDYLRTLWAKGTPESRLIFFRLLSCERSISPR